jgi:hypothetical protein
MARQLSAQQQRTMLERRRERTWGKKSYLLLVASKTEAFMPSFSSSIFLAALVHVPDTRLRPYRHESGPNSREDKPADQKSRSGRTEWGERSGLTIPVRGGALRRSGRRSRCPARACAQASSAARLPAAPPAWGRFLEPSWLGTLEVGIDWDSVFVDSWDHECSGRFIAVQQQPTGFSGANTGNSNSNECQDQLSIPTVKRNCRTPSVT